MYKFVDLLLLEYYFCSWLLIIHNITVCGLTVYTRHITVREALSGEYLPKTLHYD